MTRNSRLSLLSISADAKTRKGQARRVLTGILYLTPGALCPWASPGCLAGCLYTAGRGSMTSVQRGRERKSRFFAVDRAAFMARLRRDIAALVRKADREDMIPAVRLNGTSDLPWERIARPLFAEFPTVRFYDYTKSVDRALASAHGDMPQNYDLTYSVSEKPESLGEAFRVLAAGGRIAVVAQPSVAIVDHDKHGVVNGDRDDTRFMDPAGVVVLTPKGALRKSDPYGFCQDAATIQALANYASQAAFIRQGFESLGV